MLKNTKQTKMEILKILAYFFVLTFITTFFMREVSLKHIVFLLADAILFNLGMHLFEKPCNYCRGIAILMGVICSIFLIRYLTPTIIKVWEVDNYLSFAFAISNILLLSIAWTGSLTCRRIIAGILLIVVFLPILGCWGYYFSAHAWANADAIMAILQTNFNEALSYIRDRTSFVMYIVLALSLVCWALLIKAVKHIRLKQGSWKYCVLVLIFALSNIMLLVRTRENFLTNIYTEAKEYQASYDEYAKKKEERKHNLSSINIEYSKQKGIYVLVIGESENRTRMSAYGYSLDTTPWLRKMKSDNRMLLFQNAYSCHVQTVPVLAYALTAKNQYNKIPLGDQASVLDMAEAAGYDTVWLSNQVKIGNWGTPISVMAGEANQQIWLNSHVGDTQDTNYYDGELLKYLDELKLSDKMLIIIHLMGSHLSYQSRYPSDFGKFFINNKSGQYDNSVLYTDYFLQKLVAHFNKMPNFRGLVYFSDHGEGINYGKDHDPGAFIFDMTYIPFFIYLSDGYIKENPRKYQILKSEVNYYFTNDLIYNTMLGIMGIKDKRNYEPQNDLTSGSYDNNIERFTTLFGRKAIKEDTK